METSNNRDLIKTLLEKNNNMPNPDAKLIGRTTSNPINMEGEGFAFNQVGNLREQEIVNEIRTAVSNKFRESLITAKKDDIVFHDNVKTFIRSMVAQSYENHILIESLTSTIYNDIIGFGPLQILLQDKDITEIMVTRFDLVYIEKNGKMELAEQVRFNDRTHLENTIQKIVQPMGKKIDEAEPLVDTSLPDGSRVNATFPPATPDGPTLTIRKFSEQKLGPDDYLKFGSLDEKMIEFLKFAIRGKANIIVAGGTGTGKTSLLNMISRFVDEKDAITTIEDTLELQLQQNNVRRLLSRQAVNGKGELTIRRLVKNTLRMRPDRIIVGEIRGGEIYDMLDAMSSGHEGGMGTIHSKSPRHLVDIRIPILMAMSDISIEENAQRKMVSDAIDLIVYIKRFKDGTRKITNITEVVGYGREGASKLKIKNAEDTKIYLQDVFAFEENGYIDGKMQGQYKATGYVPKRIIEKAAIYNAQIDENIFQKVERGPVTEKTETGNK